MSKKRGGSSFNIQDFISSKSTYFKTTEVDQSAAQWLNNNALWEEGSQLS